MKKIAQKKIELMILQTKALPFHKDIKLCSEISANSSIFSTPQSAFNNEYQNSQGFTISNQHISKQNYHEDKKKQKILDLYLYLDNQVYFTELLSLNLNKELNWEHNKKFTQSLKSCLSGKNNHAIVNLSEDLDPKLTFSCDYQESGIRIMFFQVQMVCLQKPAFEHAKKMLKSYNQRIKTEKIRLQTEQCYLNQQIDKCTSIMAQLRDSHNSQINHIKNNFLPIINRIKQKTKVVFKQPPQRIDQIKRKNNDDEQQQQTQSRKFGNIKKVSSGGQRQSENFQKLFDKN